MISSRLEAFGEAYGMRFEMRCKPPMSFVASLFACQSRNPWYLRSGTSYSSHVSSMHMTSLCAWSAPSRERFQARKADLPILISHTHRRMRSSTYRLLRHPPSISLHVAARLVDPSRESSPLVTLFVSSLHNLAEHSDVLPVTQYSEAVTVRE